VQRHLNSFLLTRQVEVEVCVAICLQLAATHALGNPLVGASLSGFMAAKAAEELLNFVRNAKPEQMWKALIGDAKLRRE
jgi:hypothetical protein